MPMPLDIPPTPPTLAGPYHFIHSPGFPHAARDQTRRFGCKPAYALCSWRPIQSKFPLPQSMDGPAPVLAHGLIRPRFPSIPNQMESYPGPERPLGRPRSRIREGPTLGEPSRVDLPRRGECACVKNPERIVEREKAFERVPGSFFFFGLKRGLERRRPKSDQKPGITIGESSKAGWDLTARIGNWNAKDIPPAT